MKSPLVLFVAAGAALIALSLVVAGWLLPPSNEQTGNSVNSVAINVGGIKIGGPFRLVDHDGRTVSEKTFSGRPLLIYFGYTYCPDICPTELNNVAGATELLDTQGIEVQPLFITVDPERDTVDVLRDYVTAFHDRMIGLTGSVKEITDIAKAYRVYFAKAANPGDAKDEYLMDHTSYVYLMGADGQFLAIFRQNTSPEDMAMKTTELLKK